jgi:hypothetical protein
MILLIRTHQRIHLLRDLLNQIELIRKVLLFLKEVAIKIKLRIQLLQSKKLLVWKKNSKRIWKMEILIGKK